MKEKEIDALKKYFEEIGFSDVEPIPKYGSKEETDKTRYYEIISTCKKDKISIEGLFLGQVNKIDFVNRKVNIYLASKDLKKIRNIYGI